MKKLSNNLKGIIYILLGMFIIAFQDIAIKILSTNPYPVYMFLKCT